LKTAGKRKHIISLHSSYHTIASSQSKKITMSIRTYQILFRGKNSVRAHPSSIILPTVYSRRSSDGLYRPLSSFRRFSDESKGASKSVRDSRLAGRRRFYKYVGVQPVGAPWEEGLSSDASSDQVNSPISAGVDGTQSASGVKGSLSQVSSDSTRKMILPRKPLLNSSVDTDDEAVENIESPVRWYGITLDGRTVKTPLGMTLAVPSEMLAWAIAAEWNSQEDYLQPAQMPLMTLACTALDQTASSPGVVQEQALKFLATDTICYWADPTEDRVLHRRQRQAWESIHSYCEKNFGDKAAVAMGATEGLLMSRVRNNKSIGLPHPEKVVTGARKIVQSLDAWHLTALSSVCSGSKSLLVALASLADDTIPNSTIKAARIEEEFQISNWGLVEGGHDYDRLNCSIQILSAHIFVSSIRIDNKF